MRGLYWFSLVVGVGLYLVSLFADLFGHGDADVHGDVDLGHADMDLGHADADLGHADADADHADGFRILSLRNATYALFAFGVSGVTLTWLWQGRRGFAIAVIATLLGLGGGALSAFLFRWLRRSESGELPSDTSLYGVTGRVLLPLSGSGTGKIVVSRGTRELELLARPFDPDAEHPEHWTAVMVIDMRDGVALVSPSDPALGGGDHASLASPSEN